MKRITLLTILYTLLSINVLAQVGEYRNDLAIGINGGYALNQISYSWDGPRT